MRPATVVRDEPGLVALFIPDGCHWRAARTLEGNVLRLPWQEWKLSEPMRWYNHGLRIYPPGEAYSISIAWTLDWRMLFWYVNVEEPLSASEGGFDFMDWTLDVVVATDLRSHFWKDEAELEEAVRRGVYTPEHAVDIRAAAEAGLARLIAREAPFDEPWEDWRPDPAWGTPRLPERRD